MSATSNANSPIWAALDCLVGPSGIAWKALDPINPSLIELTF